MIDCSDYATFSQFSAGHGLLEATNCFFQRAPMTAEAAGSSLWMIIALPLLGAFISGVFGKALGRANVNLIACASVFGSFLLSLLVYWTAADWNTTAANPYSLEGVRYAVNADFGTWFSAGDFKVTFGLMADHLSGTMLLVITGVGFLIHLYATSYMSHDPGYWRFFAYLNLFIAMMLTLVLADSLVLLFVGWEGVGLCSYLLIGFWYDDAQKAYAGRKAFIMNRIGDLGFLIACFLLVMLVQAFQAQGRIENYQPRMGASSGDVAARFNQGVAAKGSLGFMGLEELAKALPGELRNPIAEGPLKGRTFGFVLTAILLCFLLGAAGKSAQLPLFVWLPDAMAGPTPVSALIHAATMVTAGIYLFCRLSYFVVLSPFAMASVAVIGGATALIAALIAFAQNDMKKVLAYSTVSQLGFMFMGIGSGLFWAAFLHVVTHAFFKACLFLSAGSVMHGNADEGDIRKLGGLRKQQKLTWIAFAVATLAITGIVPLSGFFSKDAILHGLHTHELEGYPHVLHYVWYVGLAAALSTAFYMTRLYLLTFEGDRAPDARIPHAHESDASMTGVILVLAGLSVAAVAHGIPFMDNVRMGGPKQTLMENFLSPVFATSQALVSRTANVKLPSLEEQMKLPWGAWGMAWAIALLGGLAAVILYTRVLKRGQVLTGPWAFLQKLSLNKFYFDEAYDLAIVRPIKFVSFVFFKVIDSMLIDTVAVRGTAWVTLRVGSMLRYFQSGDAQGYAAVMALALAVGLGWALLRILP
ncbi:MAG: NADH-ubiquinone oxidoreductase chain [Myxococcaceae bacterium]|nr:NADH-ubiquinone oxidoreductase chain [Myxococcaceae bacterium]